MADPAAPAPPAANLPRFVAVSKDDIPEEVRESGAKFGVDVPAGLTTIETYAFKGCTGLTQVALPAGLTKIGSYAFSGCTGLTQVTLPAALTQIGRVAFGECTGLTQIALPDGLTMIQAGAFNGCTGLTQVALPDGLTTIRYGAFKGCTGLTQVALPDGLTQIGNYAFEGCTGLTQVAVPNALTTIGEGAFNGCTGLTQVTLPPGLTNVADCAFARCANIATVLITPDLTSRGFPAVLRSAVRTRLPRTAAVRWAPHKFTFTTLRGDVVEVQLAPDIPKKFPADFSIVAEVAAAAAAELGVVQQDIYIVDGKVILYRPTITVSVVVLAAGGGGGGGTARLIELSLATECGAIDDNDAVAPTTVFYAAQKVARSVFGLPGSDAGSAIQLHVGDGGAGSDQGFRKRGGRDQGAALAAAGIVDGAVLGVTPRKRGLFSNWFRGRVELEVIASASG